MKSFLLANCETAPSNFCCMLLYFSSYSQQAHKKHGKRKEGNLKETGSKFKTNFMNECSLYFLSTENNLVSSQFCVFHSFAAQSCEL